MDLSVLISLDSLADEFLHAIAEQTRGPWPCVKTADSFRLSVASTEWLPASPSDRQTSLAHLGDTILDRLERRAVNRVDIGFVLSGSNPQSVELFLPLYSHFETFLRVVTVRRLYLVYPRTAKLLKEFAEHMVEIRQNAETTQHAIAEVHFLLEPETDKKGLVWPRDVLRAYVMNNVMAGCRAKLDEHLATMTQRTCHSSYGACVYDRESWKDYYVHRSALDLTKRRPSEKKATIGLRVEKFVDRLRLLHNESVILYSLHEIAEFRPPETLADLAEIASRAPSVETHITDSKQRLETLSADIEHSDRVPIAGAVQGYRHELADIFDENDNSLDGFEGALYFHRSLLKRLDNPNHHAEFFTQMFGELLPMLAEKLLAFTNAATNKSSAAAATVTSTELAQRVASLERAFGDLPWTESTLRVRSAVLRLLNYLKTTFEIGLAVSNGEAMPGSLAMVALEKSFDAVLEEHLSDRATTDAILEDAERLDALVRDVLNRCRQRQTDLEQVRTEFGFFRRVFSFRVYHRRLKPISDELRELKERYAYWRTVASAFCALVADFWFIQEHIRKAHQLFSERKRQLAATGAFLDKFSEALDARHEQLSQTLRQISEEPQMITDTELSFLAKPQHEQLYGDPDFGPASVGDYIGHLVKDAGVSWGAWAVDRLATYLDSLAAYCEDRFEKTPNLELPKLMFERFPEQRRPRIKHLVKVVSEQLMPLTEENLHERWFAMLFGLPQSHLDQLRADEPSNVHEDNRVSLNPTRADYVDNSDSKSLDLTVNLCGFRLEDYILYGVFSPAEK